jgi:hypothetical protein
MADFTIRRAGEADSEEILAVLKVVTAERIYSAIERPEALEQERIYLRSLSLREATHIAVAESVEVIGFQNLDRTLGANSPPESGGMARRTGVVPKRTL